MELITWIQDNITAIINTMGAVSLFITIMSYRDSKRQKLLGYRLNCNTVISKSMSNISNLEIRYSGKIITDFSISTIIIKNCGISAIEPKDFGSNSHLKITSNGEIFSAIISERDDLPVGTCDLKLNIIDKKCVQIEFDYIKAAGMFSLTLFHSGEIEVQGDLKEGEILNSKSYKIVNPLFKYALYVPFGSIVVFFMLGVWFMTTNPPIETGVYLLSVIGVVFIVSVVLTPTIKSRLKGMIDF